MQNPDLKHNPTHTILHTNKQPSSDSVQTFSKCPLNSRSNKRPTHLPSPNPRPPASPPAPDHSPLQKPSDSPHKTLRSVSRPSSRMPSPTTNNLALTSLYHQQKRKQTKKKRTKTCTLPHHIQTKSALPASAVAAINCSRPVGPSASCARCSRLGLTCQPGLQRRVGRPPRKDAVEVVLHSKNSDAVRSTEDVQFIQGLLDDSATWDLDPFCTYTPEGLPFPMDAWPAVQELDPPEIEQKVILPSPQLFDTLCKLNGDFYRGWEFVTQLANSFRLGSFVCEDHNMKNGYENIQLVLKVAQEFLVVLKSLHRQLGTRTVSCQGRKPHTNKLVWALTADTVSESTSPSSDGTTPTSGSATSQPPPVFDSPTMFLVISCYVQLIKHLEFVFKITFNSLSDPSQDLLESAPMAFADVPLVEPSTQFMLFSELIRHIMSQINLLIGFPSPWSSKSAWTGLMTCQRYKDMLNVELGAVEDGWTTRPNKLMELNRITKLMLDEFSMMGIY